MRDLRLALPVGLAFAALAAAGCGDRNDEGSATTSTPDVPRLIATVGSPDDPDAYEISLTTEDGEKVTTVLASGEYLLEFDDLVHHPQLPSGVRGRTGVDLATEIAGTGERATAVMLQEPEAYIYFCDAHPARMEVTFSIHDRIRTQN